MRSIDFPRTIPAPPAGAKTIFGEPSPDRVASAPELTQRVTALEHAHQHDADYMTACGIGVGNLRAEVAVMLDHKQQQIDALSREVESLRALVRAAGVRVA